MFYSFTAPADTLLIMYFENTANTSKIGITEIATDKYVAPWLRVISWDALRVAIITGRVIILFLLRRIIGRR